MRIFEKNKISPKGRVLSKDEFRLFSDIKEPVFDKTKLQLIIKKAESFLDAEIKTTPLWAYRQYMESGNLAIYSSYYMDRLNKMFYLGIAEAYEKKGRFTVKLLDYIWAILETSSWVIPEHTWHFPHHGATKVPPVVGDKYMHGLELAAIYLGATLAVVYTYNKDAIDEVSPIISERIEYELKNRIIRPYLNCDFSWEGDRGNKVNNWCPWNISNILLVTALIEEDMYNRERVVEKALRHIDNFVSWYKDDGGCDEGPTYWGAAGGSLFDCLETLEDMTAGAINVYSEPIVKAIGEYVCRMNISGNRFVNFADSSARGVHDGRLLRRYGEKCGSDILVAFGDVMASLMSDGLHYSHPYRSLKFLLTPPVDKTSVIPKAAKSCYFPDLKVMVERESEDPNVGLLLAIKGGHNGESHNHNDVGNFVVYYNGEPVLIDTGVGNYTRQTFSAQRYELWFMQSRYHNLPMFDGVGQMQGGQYASKDEVYDKESRTLTLDISGAYTPEVGVRALLRSATLGEGEVILTDTVELECEKLMDFCFMTHREPSVIEPGKISLTMDRQLSYDPTLLEARIEEFDPTGMNTERTWGTDKLWRIHLECTAKSGKFTYKIT